MVLATRNAGKAREFGRLLGPVMSVEALDACIDMPDETGSTFVDNARLKAEAVAAALGGATAVLADDSGLEVDALDGRPGVFSARFAGDGASDGQNVAKLLTELSDVQDRGAGFVCCLCLCLPSATDAPAGARLVEVRGVLRGQIVREPRGDDGFGYDPVFEPEGWSETLAEAAPRDKDKVSHRGAASRELIRHLQAMGFDGGQAG